MEKEIINFCESVGMVKSGGTYKTNCPLHKEKTPSFHVDPKKMIWHCFGCGKSGTTADLPILFKKA